MYISDIFASIWSMFSKPKSRHPVLSEHAMAQEIVVNT